MSKKSSLRYALTTSCIEAQGHDITRMRDAALFVTDGQASTDFAESYKRIAKERGAMTYGVAIGNANVESLEKFCDRVMQIDDLSGENAATNTLFEI